MIQGRLELDDGGVEPGGAVPVHQLLVDHGGLSSHSSATQGRIYHIYWCSTPRGWKHVTVEFKIVL